MTLCHPTVFLIKASSTFILNQIEDHQQVNLIVNQQLIGKLVYLSCETRLDIAFIGRQLSRHNSDFRTGHLCITKQVLRFAIQR